MTIETIKSHLVAALKDADSKVIALSGRWGTGKSHLWSEVQKASKDDKVKGAIYVSLFGLATMDQVKMKVVQSAMPMAVENPSLFEGVKATIGGTLKALEGLHKSFSGLGALGELAILLTPTILKNKLIVLDDIERKHEKLSVEEVLGFIDEFTQRHGARFVLVLNTDRLEDRPLWDTFREKVIDVELKLETSPEEAFDIAISLTPSLYAQSIKIAVAKCGVANIRIVRKIIRSVNKILGNREGLSEALLARVIPSTVLLSAVHYRGIEDGPPMEYVLAAGASRGWLNYLEKEEKLEESEAKKRESGWNLLLTRLGIYRCGEYEQLIVDYLESGLFETESVSSIVDRYTNEEQSLVARYLAGKFMQDSFWEHRMSETQLLEQAEALAKHAERMDASTLTNVCETIADLPSGQKIADAMIAAWIETYKNQEAVAQDDDFPLRQKLHPSIQAEFATKKAQAQARISVFEVCKQVAEHRSWGARHKVAMLNSTAQDFEQLIKNLPTSDLQLLLSQMIEFLTNRSTYGHEFDVGASQFAIACQNIVNMPDSGRLGSLLRSLFEGASISDLLVPIDASHDLDEDEG